MAKALVPRMRAALSPARAETAHRPMLLVILLLAALGLAWERVPAGGGLGWDGIIYARMVEDIGGLIGRGELSPYHAQRVLPALVVKGLLAATGTAPSAEAIMGAFGIYNLALLIAGCLLWKAVADLHHLGVRGRWIGFCGLFLSFQAAKLNFYYPVLTDTGALVFGLLMVLLYGAGRHLPLMLASIVGAFCWPTIGLAGALLLLFPHDAPRPEPPETLPRRPTLMRLYGVAAICAVAGYAAMAAAPATSCGIVDRVVAQGLGALGGFGQAIRGWETMSDPCRAARELLTALPAVLGLGLGLAVMLLPLLSWGEALRHLSRLRLANALYAVVAFAVPIVVVRLIGDPGAPSPSSLKYIVRIIMLPAEGKVLMPLVGAFVYWGPLILVAIPLWREAAGAARSLGLGALLTIAFTLPFGLVGEGRFLTAAWPFMVLALAMVLDRRPLGWRFGLPFGLLTLAFAQFWLPLNIGPWEGGSLDELQSFPKQMYFLHFGPWMNWTTFSLQFAVMVLGGIWLAAALRRERASPLPA